MPVTRVCLPGTVRAPFSSRASALYRMSLTSVDFPEPDTPVTATKQPSGKATSTPRRLCSLAPLTTTSLPLAGLRRVAGSGIDSRPVRYAPVSESLLASRSSSGPETTMCPPCSPAPRADVHHPVRGPDRVLVVLHDDEGVAQVAQPQQGLQQPVVVPLVQPDGRLVEHVQHAHQPGADLGGQPDPLRLAAGQRGRRPVQRQVVEADVEQEPQPGVDLLEDAPGDLRGPGRTAPG